MLNCRLPFDNSFLKALRLLLLKGLAGKSDNLFTTGLWIYLLLELIVNSIFSPPYVEGSFSGRMLKGNYTYSFDTLVNFFVLFKLYYIVRVIRVLSVFFSERAKVIAKKHKLQLDFLYAIKCLLRRSPLLTFFLLFPIFICIFGVTVRTFEYGYVDDSSDEAGKTKVNSTLENYYTSFLLIIITMLTIGYGDIYPRTHLGRVVCFVSVVVGMFLVSL